MTAYTGNGGDNSLTGTSDSHDVLVGKSGSDTLDGGDGADILLGGGGNDFLYYDEYDIRTDGGSGEDTLIFSASQQTLDLSLQQQVAKIERFEMVGGGGHSIRFTSADVLRVSDKDSFRISGGSSSEVTFLDSGWAFQYFLPDDFAVYAHAASGATVAIAKALEINGLPSNATISTPAGYVDQLPEGGGNGSSSLTGAAGTIMVADPELTESHLLMKVTAAADNLGSLTLTADPSLINLSNGGYVYTVDNADTRHLGDDQTSHTDYFTVYSVDGTSFQLSFTINGINNTPAFTSTITTPSIDEAAPGIDPQTLAPINQVYTVSGRMYFTDPDSSHFSAQLSSLDNLLAGTICSAEVNEAESYVDWEISIPDSSLDTLKSGQTLTPQFALRVMDGAGGYSEQTFTVNINGADDPIIGTAMADLINGFSSSDLISALGGNDTIQGGDGDDTIYGGDGNDRLRGEGGTDHLYGGLGSDLLVVSDSADVVIEHPDEGYDTLLLLQVSSYTLAAGASIEVVNATGDTPITFIGNDFGMSFFSGSGNDEIHGAGGNDTINASLGSDRLLAGDGDDVLNGGPGDDSMEGGSGNDSYTVDSVNDAVIERFNEGTDTVYATTSWTLGDHTENLVLQGGSLLNGTGNALDNEITGNEAANVLEGKDGSDTLNGGGGMDQIWGGEGDDLFNLRASQEGACYGEGGNDTFVVLGASTELMMLYGGAGVDTFVFSADGNGSPLRAGIHINDFNLGAGQEQDRIDLSGNLALYTMDRLIDDAYFVSYDGLRLFDIDFLGVNGQALDMNYLISNGIAF